MINDALKSVDHGEKARRLLWDRHQFPGAGQRLTYVVTINEALEFLDCLPDRHTDDIKAYIRTQFLRVTGGDPTLHDEIDCNAASTGPVQQLAREAVGITDAQPSVDDTDDRALKLRKLLLEVEQAEFALEQARKQAQFDHSERTFALLQSYESSKAIDPKTKQMLRDHALSTLLSRRGKTQLLIESGEQHHVNDDEEDLTITEVLRDLGVEPSHEAKQAVGRITARMYRDTYNAEPLKNKQVVQGKEQYVSWYKRKHEGLLVDAVNEYKTAQARKREPGQLSVTQCVGFTPAS